MAYDTKINGSNENSNVQKLNSKLIMAVVEIAVHAEYFVNQCELTRTPEKDGERKWQTKGIFSVGQMECAAACKNYVYRKASPQFFLAIISSRLI